MRYDNPNAEAGAGATTAGAGASSTTATDTAGSYQRDIMQSEAKGQDVGTDERYSVGNADARDLFLWNQKRTGDQAQSLDLEAMLRARRIEDEERQMRLRQSEQLFQQTQQLAHAESQQRLRLNYAEAEQRLRHNDLQNTLRTLQISEVIEAISSKVADKVCDRVKAA